MSGENSESENNPNVLSGDEESDTEVAVNPPSNETDSNLAAARMLILQLNSPASSTFSTSSARSTAGTDKTPALSISPEGLSGGSGSGDSKGTGSSGQTPLDDVQMVEAILERAAKPDAPVGLVGADPGLVLSGSSGGSTGDLKSSSHSSVPDPRPIEGPSSSTTIPQIKIEEFAEGPEKKTLDLKGTGLQSSSHVPQASDDTQLPSSTVPHTPASTTLPSTSSVKPKVPKYGSLAPMPASVPQIPRSGSFPPTDATVQKVPRSGSFPPTDAAVPHAQRPALLSPMAPSVPHAQRPDSMSPMASVAPQAQRSGLLPPLASEVPHAQISGSLSPTSSVVPQAQRSGLLPPMPSVPQAARSEPLPLTDPVVPQAPGPASWPLAPSTVAQASTPVLQPLSGTSQDQSRLSRIPPPRPISATDSDISLSDRSRSTDGGDADVSNQSETSQGKRKRSGAVARPFLERGDTLDDANETLVKDKEKVRMCTPERGASVMFPPDEVSVPIPPDLNRRAMSLPAEGISNPPHVQRRAVSEVSDDSIPGQSDSPDDASLSLSSDRDRRSMSLPPVQENVLFMSDQQRQAESEVPDNPMSSNVPLDPNVPGVSVQNVPLDPNVPGVSGQNVPLDPNVPGVSGQNVPLDPNVPGVSGQNVPLDPNVPGVSGQNVPLDPNVPGVSAQNVPLDANVPGVSGENVPLDPNVAAANDVVMESSADEESVDNDIPMDPNIYDPSTESEPQANGVNYSETGSSLGSQSAAELEGYIGWFNVGSVSRGRLPATEQGASQGTGSPNIQSQVVAPHVPSSSGTSSLSDPSFSEPPVPALITGNVAAQNLPTIPIPEVQATVEPQISAAQPVLASSGTQPIAGRDPQASSTPIQASPSGSQTVRTTRQTAKAQQGSSTEKKSSKSGAQQVKATEEKMEVSPEAKKVSVPTAAKLKKEQGKKSEPQPHFSGSAAPRGKQSTPALRTSKRKRTTKKSPEESTDERTSSQVSPEEGMATKKYRSELLRPVLGRPRTRSHSTGSFRDAHLHERDIQKWQKGSKKEPSDPESEEDSSGDDNPDDDKEPKA